MNYEHIRKIKNQQVDMTPIIQVAMPNLILFEEVKNQENVIIKNISKLTTHRSDKIKLVTSIPTFCRLHFIENVLKTSNFIENISFTKFYRKRSGLVVE